MQTFNIDDEVIRECELTQEDPEIERQAGINARGQFDLIRHLQLFRHHR